MAGGKKKKIPPQQSVGAVLTEFKEKFESVYGGAIVFSRFRKELLREDYWDLEIEGFWLPLSGRCAEIKWRGGAYKIETSPPSYSPSKTKAPYKLYFEVKHDTSAASIEGGIKSRGERNVPYHEVARRKDSLAYLLRRILQIPFEEESKVATVFKFFSQREKNEIVCLLVNDLPKIAKGEHKGWRWWLELATMNYPSTSLDKVGVTGYLCFSRGEVVSRLPIQITHNFVKEEKELPYTIAFLTSVLYPNTIPPMLVIKEPLKEPKTSSILHGIEFGRNWLEKHQQIYGAFTLEGVIDSIAKIARHAVDNILSLPDYDKSRKEIIKAAAILYAAGIVISAYLTPPNRITIGSLLSIGIPTETLTTEPYQSGAQPQQKVKFSRVVRFSFSFEFKYKDRSAMLHNSGFKRFNLGPVKGTVVLQDGYTEIVFSVEPIYPHVPAMTQTYSFAKGIHEISDDEIKEKLLDFMRALSPHLRQMVQKVTENLPFRRRL